MRESGNKKKVGEGGDSVTFNLGTNLHASSDRAVTYTTSAAKRK